MDLDNPLFRVALALGVGLLIGLERGWRRRDAEPGARAAGIRTFAISGLLGGIAGAIAKSEQGGVDVGGGIFLAAAFAAYCLIIALFSREENKALGVLSATTAIAGMLTFALGAYALLGDVRIAAASAVAATAILALREELHDWVQELTWPELRSGLVLLAMTFIALPVVPNDPIGPFGGVNPREIWLIAIVLAAVSFLGYVAVKYLGARRGVMLAAAAGGLVSSTAVTVANAHQAAAGQGAPRLLAAGVAVATATSFARVLAIVAVLQPRLLVMIGPAVGTAAIVAVGFACVSAIRSGAAPEQKQQATFRNPFGFWSVIGFACLLGGVILLGRAVSEHFGAVGALVGASFAGLADVDAITVAMARLTPDTLTATQSAHAILAAVASNTAAKVLIGGAIGRGWFAVAIAGMALSCLIAATLAFVLSATFVLH